MLKHIITGKEPTKILVIRDNTDVNGSEILKCVLSALSQRVDVIHLFLLEMLPGTITSLAQHVIDRLTVHNISKDPLGWDGNTTISMESDFLEYLTRIIDLNKKCAVVIDSISNLILHRGASYTCRVLHKCSTLQRQKDVETSPVIALIHQDVHDETAMNMICHTASTVIDLHPPQSQDYSGSCHILHKKSSGKIIKITEQYKINRSYDDIINVEEIKQQFGLIDKPQETVADPAANLTFNLSLSEKEKLARSKVVLPYIQKPERSDVGVSSAGSGKIFYQPDEADDFDEEDPDDDLDI